ncbi:nucleotidyltransferase domain-containing protein [Ornithinimicrobium cerasi]|uniref:Nucleotidyltransferase domain-containing protein n=1 Tax=Ornithinimicrobium cerasi TaxID=2248773 RepID=A0A285VVF6_9MICO|nr:nucleotidyltransferase domain-containing protein [Ornithinimicrobium cerasi]SOC58039.1 hypothetical protein SAMN05421879_1216 [Ornithinimicrobium cerasi]
MPPLPPPQGIDAQGFVVREGDRSRVPAPFLPLVSRYVELVTSSFADVHSVYLYGSLPRGTARVGSSDLDGQVVLGRPVTPADQEVRRQVETELATAYPVVDGVGVLLDDRAVMLDPGNRFDHGFHLRVLCTPVWGPDAGADVPPHRPDVDLARGIQGDWRAVLARLREEGPTAGGERAYCRAVGRRLTRLAFTWGMPRWGGWTSDPVVITQVVGALEPGWEDPVAEAVGLGWHGVTDVRLAHRLLGAWTDELVVAGTELGA